MSDPGDGGSRASLTVRGIAASSGIAIGRVVVVHRRVMLFERVELPPKRVKREVQRFHRAVAESVEQLRELKTRVREQASPATGDDHVHILEAHELMLGDELLVGATAARVAEERINAEWALEKTLEGIRAVFGKLDDEVFRERLSDVDFVGERILRNLLGHGCDHVDEVHPDHVVVADKLSPAETVQMLHRNVLALATDVGSRTSHTAIVARALEIPAVVGLRDVSEQARIGDMVIVDGDEGLVILHPTRSELSRYRTRRSRAVVKAQELLRNRELESVTRDGQRVPLRANIDFIEEANSMFANGGEGVGLFRTEFLYLNRESLPDEEEQYQVYRGLLERVHPYATTIRTLDLGGDKFASLDRGARPAPEIGGLRAIRLCLRREDIFRVQLRALLRTSVHGTLRILVPFVTCVAEIRRVVEILDELRVELRFAGQPFDEDVELGIMIETPSAVQIADLLAPYVRFFSIGTNDLIQYTLALAREDPDVSYLYHPLHPAILRMVRRTAEAARQAGISCGMCGEMAADPVYALVLVGLGITELSMVPRAIPAVKEIVRQSTVDDARRLLHEIWPLPTYQDVESHVVKAMHARFPSLVREL